MNSGRREALASRPSHASRASAGKCECRGDDLITRHPWRRPDLWPAISLGGRRSRPTEMLTHNGARVLGRAGRTKLAVQQLLPAPGVSAVHGLEERRVVTHTSRDRPRVGCVCGADARDRARSRRQPVRCTGAPALPRIDGHLDGWSAAARDNPPHPAAGDCCWPQAGSDVGRQRAGSDRSYRAL
jgi:hypothetical protein